VYHRTNAKTEGSLDVSLVPRGLLVHVFSGFVQDQIAVIPDKMYVTLGTKLEHNTYSGFGIMPTARVAYQLDQKQMVWAAISRALRTPAETDVSLRLNVGGFTQADGTPVAISIFGNPHVKDEGLTACEAGYRVEINRRLSLDLAAYYNDYDQQNSSEPGIPFFEESPAPPHLVLPSITENLLNGETYGLEISGSWKVTPRWTLTASSDFERIHMHPRPGSQDFETGPEIEGSDPHEHARLRSHVDLPHKIGWESNFYFTGRLASGPVPAYTRADTGATWQWKGGFSASVFGENLLKANHLEFNNAGGVATSTSVRRGWHAKITWRF
jgi:iron complex outermembrane recepter protein